jgi:hypothetical protein
MRSRRAGQIADTRPFAADRLHRRVRETADPRFCTAVDFPAFLCRIRDFPAMLWPDVRVASTRVRALGLPVVTLDRILRCRNAEARRTPAA